LKSLPAFLFLALAACNRKQPEAEKAPAREARASDSHSESSIIAVTHPSDLAASALTAATGPDACFQAASDLARIGTARAVRLLIDQATSRKNADEASAIFDSLAHLTTPESIHTLAELTVRRKSPAVLKFAIPIIASRADSETVEILTTLLYERPAPANRDQKVLFILKSIDNPQAARALGRLLLSTQEATVIDATATALGSIATPTARAALQQALDDRLDLSPTIRASIQQSLENIPQESRE
jgi:hypothetical protein